MSQVGQQLTENKLYLEALNIQISTKALNGLL